MCSAPQENAEVSDVDAVAAAVHWFQQQAKEVSLAGSSV
jgi:hypothetical protein